MFKAFFRVLTTVVLSGSIIAQSAGPGTAIMGFTSDRASAQRALEARFDSFLKAENLRDWNKRLSARPHHLGSAAGKENAEFIASQFRSWGYDTTIEEFEVLFPTPKTRVVEMTSPETFKLKLNEPALKEDATSGQQDEQLPTYNAYSIDGDVTGPLVYVNYGTPADYEELERRGITVKGKIAISRYGGSWRGIKPKVAAEHGAIGCIIYSDPRNDGFYQGDVYPKGAWRREDGVQRGSVMDMPLYPGDPLTKGVGAVKNAKRIDLKKAETLTRIPVLPISYSDALPLLRNLDGAVVPESWRGALPITYHFGGKTPTVRMKLEFNWDRKPIYNVIAKMAGSELPDQWIIRGNHHDAWVNGSDDPISGMVAEMEEARAIGELAKTGWKPKRTIVYAAWDAEEQGLLGSTEWVETHADELNKKAAVYINTDSNGRGFLGMGGSHTLEKFVNEIGKDIPDPQTRMSVWERTRAYQMVNGSAAQRSEAMSRSDLRIGALGSGSDFTPFLQHLGIASLNIGFGGEDGGGSYHSIYDSFDHYSRFGDPGFVYGVALAKVCGHAVLRLANADTLPFEFTNFADTISQYVGEVTRLTDGMRDETKSLNQMVTTGMWQAVQDPTESNIAPAVKENVPHLNFAPLQNALVRLQESSRAFQKASTGKTPAPALSKNLNEVLFKTERALTRNEGLPRRDWFTHQIYAPGFYTGYGVKTLPGIREAIEQRDWKEATEQIVIVSRTIENFAAEIDRAASMYRMSVVNILTEGPIRIIELNRPEKRNALNDELIAALKDALREADANEDVRAIVLRGAGKDFCSGADLAAIQKIAAATYEENVEDARNLAELFELTRKVRVPVIAAVHGRALAGGAGLAFGCDLVVAARSARFGFPEVKIGFVPAMVAAIVRRNLGEKKSFELLTQGFEYTAEEGLDLGLINAVFDEKAFDTAAIEYASRYATVSGSAVATTKKLLYEIDGFEFSEAIEKGVVTNAEARMTEDCKRGIAKFLEK